MDPITFTLLAALALGHLVFLFNYTNFVSEYAALLGLGKLFLVKEYHEWLKAESTDHGYNVFIRERFPNSFFARLVGCPFCLITFLSVFCLSWIGGFFFLVYGFSIASLATITFLVEKLLYKKIFE